MPLQKKYLPLIIAAAAGLFAAFLALYYAQQQAEEARRKTLIGQKEFTTVVVARQDIPAGVTLTESMLKEETVNKALLQPRAATSTERVIDKVTLAPISKGEQILLNKVTISGPEVSLSAKIPRGKRAITIAVDNISSVGGMIRPGDRVDVIGQVPVPAMTAEGKQTAQMNTVPLFQDVLVLAVGQEFTTLPGAAGEKKEKTLSPTITLALTPQEANLISFVQEQGKIRLILRSPEDTQVQSAVTIRAGWDTVLKKVMPEAFPEAPKELGAPKKEVEIYRGSQKEVKDLE